MKHSKTLLSTAGALTLSAILAPSVSADQLDDNLASVASKEDQLTAKIKEKTAKNHLQTTLQSLVQKDDNSVIETASLKAERLQVMSQKETLKAQIANREKRAALEAKAKAEAEAQAKVEAQKAKEDAEKPKTTDEANEQGKSQIGTTSTSTGQVVHDVTKEPVETNTGASIVSTQNGNVVLSDGSVVAPEEVGGTVNEDKTISVTDSEGKLKTLPNTGAAESILGAIGAILLTAVSYVYKKKMF